MWENNIEMTEEEEGYVALLRKEGCTCGSPLLGFIPGVGPRCRMCGVEVILGKGNCPDCAWYMVKSGCNVLRDSDICLLNKEEK